MKKNLRCHVLWVMGFLMVQFGAFAQTNTVTGTVTAATDAMALPGVNVLIKGQTKGTVTDSDGKFSIEAAPSDILVFSFIGMETQEQSVGTASNINVSMFESLASLGEVVVVAYGTQKRSNITGAVSTVDVSKAFDSRPITDAGRALQGTTPGLVINTTSGALGGSPTIRIRGSVGSISLPATGAGSGVGRGSALVLVDNVEVPDLSYVNPNDIESISVLKDASTTAIYGTRAAFGAILITTKKGSKDGTVKVTYSNNFSWAKPTNIPRQSRADLNLAYSYAQIKNVSASTSVDVGQVGYYYNPTVIEKTRQWIETYGDGSGLDREMVEGRDFDYRTEGGVYYYRPWDVHNIYYKEWTPQQNHNIGVSGGNDKTQYNLSAGYVDQSGVLKQFNDFYKRLNFSGFVSTKANNWLTVRAGFMYGKAREDAPYFFGDKQVYDAQYSLYRWHNVYPYGTYGGKEMHNPANEMRTSKPEETENNYSRYTLGTTLDLLPGLTANLDYTLNQTITSFDRVGGVVYGINQRNVAAFATKPVKFENLYGPYTDVKHDFIQHTDTKTMQNTFNGYLTYNKTFDQHAVTVMGGTNIEDYEYKYVYTRRNLVYDYNLPEVNLAGGESFIEGNHNWWSVAGFFGRINYAFRDKYLLEANGRYDGSSKFAPGKRWGFFPSASAAWRISEEPWMQSLQNVLSSAKFRGSYGAVGNQDVPLNAYTPLFTLTNPVTTLNNHWLINNAYVPYIGSTGGNRRTENSEPGIVDPTLTWETVTTLDLGLDAGFFKDKLTLAADWYERKTKDMLVMGEALPSSIGANSPLQNVGELSTKGIELALTFRHAFSNGVQLTLTGQYTDYKTVVTKFPSAGDPTIASLNYEGKVYGEIWGYRTEGLFQHDDFQWDGENIKQTDKGKNAMADGVPDQYILESGLFKFSPGDVRYADLNGDGVINYGTNTIHDSGDRTVIGNTTPHHQFGFRIGAEWKGFDLSVFFQGVGKRDIWATGNMVLPGWTGTEANFEHTLDYWTPENTDAFYPRPVNHGNPSSEQWNYQKSDRYLLNGAYLRMKNLTIGYTLPTSIMNRIHAQKLRVYFSGENMLTFDKMHGVPIDPEIDWTLENLDDGRTFGRTYPYRKVLSFGLQLQF